MLFMKRKIDPIQQVIVVDWHLASCQLIVEKIIQGIPERNIGMVMSKE